MMNEEKYRSKYPDIAHLLHNTDMTYAEIGEKIGVTKQCIHWLNKRLGQFGRPPKSKVASTRKAEIADEALKRFSNYTVAGQPHLQPQPLQRRSTPFPRRRDHDDAGKPYATKSNTG